MTTIITDNLVLTKTVLDNNNAALCYVNYATFNNISASSELQTNPATNMANPATAFGWTASDTSTQTITIATGAKEVDYIGIARHNLDQVGLTITIKYDGVVVVPAQSVSSNQAILFLQGVASPSNVEIVIEGATIAPRISVLYIGKSTRLQRGIYVGHTPINYGRQRKSVNGVSENGQYLGEVVVREVNTSSVSLKNLTPEWYREALDPYFAQKPRPPAFWAWRPSGYPMEVGYVWIDGDPNMTNQLPNGMVEANWEIRGIV
jgi:hypothetical protein